MKINYWLSDEVAELVAEDGFFVVLDTEEFPITASDNRVFRKLIFDTCDWADEKLQGSDIWMEIAGDEIVKIDCASAARVLIQAALEEGRFSHKHEGIK